MPANQAATTGGFAAGEQQQRKAPPLIPPMPDRRVTRAESKKAQPALLATRTLAPQPETLTERLTGMTTRKNLVDVNLADYIVALNQGTGWRFSCA